jgi:hypothetical protein
MKIELALATSIALAFASSPAFAAVRSPAPVRVSGTLAIVRNTVLTLRLSTGKLFVVDATQATARNRVYEPLFIGQPLDVEGTVVEGVLFATSVDTNTPRREPRSHR